ncbi:MAG: WapI family immunity protein [Planctomycetota bacterium]
MRIGRSDCEFLRVEVLRRTNPSEEDYWDGNWLVTRVSVGSGGFSGNTAADLRTDEFASFLAELEQLYLKLAGTASFASMEPWLTIKVTGDGLGHFTADCEVRDGFARDAIGSGGVLSFEIAFDQTELPPIISQLKQLLAAYPVVGQP